MSPRLTITLDGKYRTRDGHIVRIYATDAGGDYTVHGAWFDERRWRENTWTIRGSAVKGALSTLDLIPDTISEPKDAASC